MSMMRCDSCDRVVDTDYDVEGFIGDSFYCASCMDRMLDDGELVDCDGCGEIMAKDSTSWKLEAPAPGDGIGDALRLCARCHHGPHG